MLIEIAGRDCITYDEKNAIILNRAETHILKNTIIKFIFDLRDSDLCFYMIKYRAKPAQSFYKAFKKAEAHILVLNVKL